MAFIWRIQDWFNIYTSTIELNYINESGQNLCDSVDAEMSSDNSSFCRKENLNKVGMGRDLLILIYWKQ